MNVSAENHRKDAREFRNLKFFLLEPNMKLLWMLDSAQEDAEEEKVIKLMENISFFCVGDYRYAI